jgi:hypothetical protein
MSTDYKTLTRENGWIFEGNCSHERTLPYPSTRTVLHHGCLYRNEYRGTYLYQWGFDTRGNAAYECTFKDALEMHLFFDPYFCKRPLSCSSAIELEFMGRLR